MGTSARRSATQVIRLTLPHWYGFAEGVRLVPAGPLTEEEWGRLRERDSAFGFGRSRDEWAAYARSNPAIVARAAAVTRLLADWGAKRLVSVGVGTGIFEFLLKSAGKDLKIRCGDWEADSIPLLRERLTDVASVERMDLRRPEWVHNPDEVVLLNRVDMELSDAEWRGVFTELAARGTRRIVWIPCGLLTVTSMFSELRGVVVGLGMRRHLYRSGYLRTPARMIELFASNYERREVIKRGDLPTWGLHLKGGG
jgi:hypothetical protein